MIKIIDLLKFTIFFTLVVISNCNISDKRLCGDPDCKSIISSGVTKQQYVSNNREVLSFRKGVVVYVFSKSADDNERLWRVSINNKLGYAPKAFITETKLNIPIDKLISVQINNKISSEDVTTKLKSSESKADNSVEIEKTAPLPEDVAPTIFTDTILNSSDEQPVQPTVVQAKVEIVDGTILPSDDNISSSTIKPKIDINNENIVAEKLALELHGEQTETTTETIKVNTNGSPLTSENDLNNSNDGVTIEDVENSTKPSYSTDNNFLGHDDKNDNDEYQEDYKDDEYVDEYFDENIKDESIEKKSEATKNEKVVKAEIKNNIEETSESANSLAKTLTDTNNIKLDELLNNESLQNELKITEPTKFKIDETNKSTTERENDNVVATNNEKISPIVPENQVPEANTINIPDNNSVSQINVPEAKTELNTLTVGVANLNTEASNIEVSQNIGLDIKSTPVISNTKVLTVESEVPNNETVPMVSNKNEDSNSASNDTPKEESKASESKTLPVSEVLKKDSKPVSTKPEIFKDSLKVANSEIVPSKKLLKIENTITLPNEDRIVGDHEILKNEILPNIKIDETNKSTTERQNDNVVGSNSEKITPIVPDSESKQNLPSFDQSKDNNSEKNEDSHPTYQPYQMGSEGTQENPILTESLPESNKLVLNPSSEIPIATTPGYEDDLSSNVLLDTTTMNPNQDIPTYSSTPLPSSDSYSTPNLNTIQNPTVDNNLEEHIKAEDETNIENKMINSNDNKAETKFALFDTILDTVKSVWSASGNGKTEEKSFEHIDKEMDAILFPDKYKSSSNDESISPSQQKQQEVEGFCEQVSPLDCPKSVQNLPDRTFASNSSENCVYSTVAIFDILMKKLLDMFDILICLIIGALTTVLFCFGYYCICHSRKEGTLLSKLNIVERNFLASLKETSILKHELIESKTKLLNIENNSFGSNDMVIALKQDLENIEDEKQKLIDQVSSLEKELETAAEAGLELNKIVSELLNNQSGDESIISSVEELQKQLNEQQNTILEINSILAEKSRENSELQLVLAEDRSRLESEIESYKQDNEELENEKTVIQTRLDGIENEFKAELRKAMNAKNLELQTMQNEVFNWQSKHDEIHTKWQSSIARMKGLEEYLEVLKENSSVNMTAFMEVAGKKVDLIAVEKERDIYKERLEELTDMKKLLVSQIKILRDEIEKSKQESNQNEKDKLEAQTRLEVLSNYFKDKETQLQKELSVKEAMWMKQQGETTSNVQRVRNMQDEIQSLRSQNDSLRAEIEAQNAAHKAQIGTLENRAHESWLAARHSERKFEEARSEAASFRRKLTSLAGNSANLELSRLPNSALDGILAPNDLNNAPSPIHMEPPVLFGGLPPVLHPPFMPPPPNFMPMPPYMPPGPGEMRPPPVGRIMSPPPPLRHHGRYSPSIIDDDDDDNNHRSLRHNHHDHHHRDRYSPRNGRYSPDDRYDDDVKYNTEIMSTYDTETDFSPPPSPHSRGGSSYDRRDRDRDRERERDHDREQRTRVSRAGSYKAFSPPPPPPTTTQSSSNLQDRNKKTNKGILSSGSEQSYDSRKGKGLV